METLKTSETLIEGLATSKQDETGNQIGETFPGGLKSFDLGENKCAEPESAPVAETGCNHFDNIKGLIDSGSHGDVSAKGFSLFVELNGGVMNDDQISSRNKSNEENTGESNGELLHENQEYGLNVGDFVWAIIKNQTWWPGVICDASCPPQEAIKLQKREDDILVRFFGNRNYIWCHLSQLKPFIEYFEQFSKQNRSKSFVGALDKALTELGLHVKNEFTCSCFSKPVVEGRFGHSGDLSVTRFEPVTFLEYIKDLARNISMPSKIDYVVNQNRLSAFYRSLGHCQIPINQLKSKIKIEDENGLFNEDGEKGIIGNSEKPYETRERRKSRFLSYPYTNINGGPKEPGMEDSKTVFNGEVELNKTDEQPVKKPRKKWTRKAVSSRALEANVCSSEVVLELRCAALDCVFPNESTRFDSIKRFITRFRKWAFNDFTSEITILPETGVQTDNSGIGTGKTFDVNITTHEQSVLNNTLLKKTRKKKGKPVFSPTTGNNANHDSVIIDFQNMGSVQLMENKKMEVTTDEGLRNLEVPEPVLDLNGNYTILNFGVPKLPPCKPVPKRRKKKTEFDASVHAWSNNNNITGLPVINGHRNPFLFPTVPQNNNGLLLNQATAFHLSSEVNSTQPCFTTEPQLGIVPVPAPPCFTSEPQLGIVPAGVNLKPKKRGRKRKFTDFPTNDGSTVIPDLNSDGTEKKKGKRIKRKEETGVPCIDLIYNKVQQDNTEVSGTAFLLKFSPDHPLPSNQDLNSVFCKYGALNESETQVLTENLSGQIVFLDSSSAGGAFWGLQKDQPFGQALVNYRVQHLSGNESTGGFKTPIKIPREHTDSITMIPDLNGNATEHKLVKRNKSNEKIHQENVENTGITILLKFSPDHPLPSNQDLSSIFCKYGVLNEFETRVSGQTLSGQVVFVNPSSAGDAVRGLEKDRPFGPGLAGYRVEHVPSGQPAIRFTGPIGLKPSQPGKSEPADLAVIRKNLEMMTSMLEKAGNSLAPEMRAKLETEIKGLMNKVTTMDGSSSSFSL